MARAPRSVAASARASAITSLAISLSPAGSKWMMLLRFKKSAKSVEIDARLGQHADDLLVLADGRLTHHGPCADPASHRALEQVFDHRIAIHALQGQWVALPVAA